MGLAGAAAAGSRCGAGCCGVGSVGGVSASGEYVHGQMERVVEWIETNRLDVEVLEYQIELL